MLPVVGLLKIDLSDQDLTFCCAILKSCALNLSPPILSTGEEYVSRKLEIIRFRVFND